MFYAIKCGQPYVVNHLWPYVLYAHQGYAASEISLPAGQRSAKPCLAVNYVLLDAFLDNERIHHNSIGKTSGHHVGRDGNGTASLYQILSD